MADHVAAAHAAHRPPVDHRSPAHHAADLHTADLQTSAHHASAHYAADLHAAAHHVADDRAPAHRSPAHHALDDRTAAEQFAAVLRSIRCITDNIGAGHSLESLARAARFSPYHFHRMFRQITTVTPAQYLAAARMAEAKRLLAATRRSVTEICMGVGYTSLGTFTTQFTRLVGVSPRRFRKVFAMFADQPFAAVLGAIEPSLARPTHVQTTAVVLGGPTGTPVLAGLFPTAVPQGRPAACAIVPTPGVVGFGGLDDGDYRPLAVAFHPRTSVAEALLPEHCWVGAARAPVVIRDGRATAEPLRLHLSPPGITDPPLVLALPLIVAAGLGA
ncbi:helix-turn-helix transcriptional regulator [Saccharothrix obliqua]|uniref:helix-turn-helix transcriptional regulator n=1 Tax=Saccharothrix obliqua TaxID=2861747 RepID=UPI001C5EE35C|nr:AraC family transcriptional regulator [Saccharothrix obliqua]MBW4721431.1 AraC family transcriptional regulator [Saccharothrix obliqua]